MRAVRSFDTDSLDAIITGVGWLVGLSMVLVGGSIVGFAFWWARALEAPGLGKLALRAVPSWAGILLVSSGAAGIAVGTEAALGYPFGASSGGLVLFAYLLGLRLATWELALAHGLLRQLAARTGAGLHAACAGLCGAALGGAWLLLCAHSFICFVVGLNMAFGG